MMVLIYLLTSAVQGSPSSAFLPPLAIFCLSQTAVLTTLKWSLFEVLVFISLAAGCWALYSHLTALYVFLWESSARVCSPLRMSCSAGDQMQGLLHAHEETDTELISNTFWMGYFIFNCFLLRQRCIVCTHLLFLSCPKLSCHSYLLRLSLCFLLLILLFHISHLSPWSILSWCEYPIFPTPLLKRLPFFWIVLLAPLLKVMQL